MPNAATIMLIRSVVAFFIRLKFAVQDGPLQIVDKAPWCFGYGKEIRWAWSRAILRILQK